MISSLQSAGDGILVCRVGGGDQLLVDSIGDIGNVSFDLGLYASCVVDGASEHGTLCSKQYEHGPVVSSGTSHLRFRVLCRGVNEVRSESGGRIVIPAIHTCLGRSHVALCPQALSVGPADGIEKE